jgi:hypothetical protein
MPANDKGIRSDLSRSNAYSMDYVEKCFLLWYKLGRPTATELIKHISPDEASGDIVHYQMLSKWSSKFAWNERADVLDAEVSRQIEIQAINEKVEMLRRQADLGKMLQDAGQEYFETHAIESDRTALGAIKTGVEIERNARGIPDALLKIAELKDEELGEIVGKLLAKINPDEALRMTGSIVETEPEETVDAEFSEKEEVVEDADSETIE